MQSIPSLVLLVLTTFGSTRGVPACELVDLATAEGLMGATATELTGGADPGRCVYQGADGVAMVVAQVNPAAIYDLVPIKEPHTSLDVGESSRFNQDESGTLAAQFLKGEFSVNLGVVPHPDRPVSTEAFKQVVRDVAARLP